MNSAKALNRRAHTVRQMLNTTWHKIRGVVTRMNRDAIVEPATKGELFAVTVQEHIYVEVSPFRFYLPERAKRATPNLHIVIDGWMEFDGSVDVLRTMQFGTRVAYVRPKESRFEHVYGTHYDQSKDDLGHPVFHAQISSMKELTKYIPGCRGDSLDDRVLPILSNVRTPTPQMDVFSTIEQICADHLLWENSQKDVRRAFKELREHCAFFEGSGHLMHRFVPTMAECCRSTHWYKPWVPGT